MATLERLEEALRKAHAAGDTAAAKRFAQAIREGEYEGAQTQEPSMLDRAADTGLGRVVTEATSAVNRGALGAVDFLGTPVRYAANAIQQRTLNPREGFDGAAMNPLAYTAEKVGIGREGFMKEGLGRDILARGGELVAPGGAVGAGLRGAANTLPKMGQAAEGVAQGALRQMGQSTARQDVGYSALSGAGAAVGGAGGEAVGGETGRAIGEAVGGIAAPVAGGLRPMSAGRRTSMENPNPRIAANAEQATGVDLLPAQRSLDPAQLRAQRFLPELSPTTQKAAESLARQNQQASTAVDDFVRMIGPDDAIVTGSEQFRTASQRALDVAKQVRAEKASPLYQRAFEEPADVDLAPVRQLMNTVRAEFPETGSVAGSINKIERMIDGNPSLKKLHNAKLEVDDMLAKVGESSLGNTAKRQVRDIKQSLLDQMEAASPAYREARLAFEEASPAVMKMQDSIIGKIANMDDTQLKNVSRRIFDPAESNPQVVKDARKVIEEVDPDAWNKLLRSEIERRIGSIKPEVGMSFENVPAKLSTAIFGTGKNRAAILSAMSPQQRKNALQLETVLTRAGLGRPGGSETAGRQQFVKDIDSGLIRTVRDWIRNPIEKATGVGEGTVFDRRAKALADTLFDPAWQGEAAKALKDKSGKSFGFLLYRVNDSIQNQASTQEQSSQEQQPGQVQAQGQPQAR